METARRVRLFVCIAFAACLIATPPADAQSWQWQVLVPVPGRAPVQAQSNVVLSASTISMVYSARIENRETPITWCHAGLADVANAQALTRDGRTFLRLQLKPQRSATCDSGSRPFAFTRIADDAAAREAVTAINRAVGTKSPVAVTAFSPSPSPSPSRPPAGSASPSASPAAAPSSSKVVDWVDNAGLFTFIRVRNRSRQPVMITTGDVENCRNLDFGCGRFPNGNITLASGAASTVATVMSNGQGGAPTFTYRYDVQSGALHVSATGSSEKAPAGWHPPMSAQEMRTAEAVAIAGFRAQITPGSAPPQRTTTPPPPAFVDARLTHRGSSRLGIGQKGVALVRVSVSGSGMPQDASIVKISNRQLVAAALETAVSSTYAPAMRNGRPVDGTYIATFTFDGDDPALSSIPAWKRDPSPAPPASAAPSGSPAP